MRIWFGLILKIAVQTKSCKQRTAPDKLHNYRFAKIHSNRVELFLRQPLGVRPEISLNSRQNDVRLAHPDWFATTDIGTSVRERSSLAFSKRTRRISSSMLRPAQHFSCAKAYEHGQNQALRGNSNRKPTICGDGSSGRVRHTARSRHRS